MRTGIVAALPGEARAFAHRQRCGPRTFRLRDGSLITLSGMGPRAARRAGRRLLQLGAEALLSWGCAAGLDNRLGSGDLIVPQMVFDADGRLFPVHTAWRAQVCLALGNQLLIHSGTLVEARSVLATPEDKRAAAEASGAVVADMESAGLATLAEEAGVPFLAIRAVADGFADTIPPQALGSVDALGRLHPLHLLMHVLLQPHAWPRLARVAGGYRAARRTLVAVARHIDGALQPPAPRPEPRMPPAGFPPIEEYVSHPEVMHGP